MPISYDMACCNSLQFPGVQHRINEYIMTMRQLPKAADATKGQLYAAASAGGGIKVYVVSDLYYPSDFTGALNLLWNSRYYRMEFDLPCKSGQGNAYIATRLVGISSAEAKSRRKEEVAAKSRVRGRANALIGASVPTQAPGGGSQDGLYNNEDDNYNNEDEGLYNNEDESLYNN